MSSRRNTMLWMKDLIEHMNRCHEQLQWADSRTQPFLTESLLTDLWNASGFARSCVRRRERSVPSSFRPDPLGPGSGGPGDDPGSRESLGALR